MVASQEHSNEIVNLDDLQVPEYHELQLLKHDSTSQLPQRDHASEAPERDPTEGAPELNISSDAPEWNVSRELPESSGVKKLLLP